MTAGAGKAQVRSFAACGVHSGDIIQNACGYGLFTGGLGARYGAEGIGASVVPISGGNTERQIKILKARQISAFGSEELFKRLKS